VTLRALAEHQNRLILFLRSLPLAAQRFPAPSRTKIYGERNSGTRFLTDLIKKNFTTPVLLGSTPGEYDELGLCTPEPSLVRNVIRDRQTHLANRRAIPDTLGWKHMSPPIDFLKAMPQLAATTLFLIIVKHPVFWALSFHRRPYSSYFDSRKLNFDEWLRQIFIPTARDNVEQAFYPSAMGIYAAKVDGYRRLAELQVPFELIRYEELISDIPRFLRRLEVKYRLPRQRRRDVIRRTSTKGDKRELGDFLAQYRLDRVTASVSADNYDFIISSFGEDRLRWLGYRFDER
jgi:hypothetical protein